MNMNPMMNNLMNPMNYIQNNIMMENSNQSLVDRGKEIRVNLEIENEGHIVKCFEGDKTSILKEKYNINKEWLSYDYRILNTEKTIKENEILDYSVVKVVPDSINIIFEEYTGQKNVLILDGNCPVWIAIIIYYLSYNNNNYKYKIISYLEGNIDTFIFNAKKMEMGDQTPIKVFFNNIVNPKVLVNPAHFLNSDFWN